MLRLFLLTPLVAVSLSCTRDAQSGGQRDGTPTLAQEAASVAWPTAACFAADSLAVRPIFFGELLESEETGDIGGLEFRFQLGPQGQLVALVRDAAGGLPPARAVDSLTYSATADTLTLWFSELGNGYIYRFRPACDALSGSSTRWITPSDPAGSTSVVTMPRVLAPMPDRP